MKSLSIFARGFCLVLFIFLVSAIHASTPQEQVPFDLQQVVEQVTHHPRIDGNTIRINGKYYEAQFEKDGFVLTEHNTKNRLKIRFDEATGDLKITDDEVRYNSADGLFSVKGKKQGLQFRKEIKENSLRSMKDGFRYRFRTEGKEARIGEILITDALGNRFKPEVAKKHDEIEILIPKKDQSKLKFPMTLLGEFMIDTSLAYGPSWDEEYSPATAFDGTNYLVVWANPDMDQLVCARVNQAGEVLDKTGFRISEAYADWEYEKPSLAFSGGNFLVVWNDFDYHNVLGVRITTSGVVLDSLPIEIGTGYVEYGYPHVASDGTNFFVVWISVFDVVNGARVTSSGIILDTVPILIDTMGEDHAELTITFSGSNYFVAWTDWRNFNDDIYGVRITTSGIVLDTAGIAISTATGSQRHPSVTFGGSNYLVVWDDSRSGSTDIYATRVNQAGTVLDPFGIAVTTAPNFQGEPAVAFDGTNYLAVWYDERNSGDIYGARISTAGTVLDPAGVRICTTSVSFEEWQPAVAFGGGNYFVVWDDWRNGDSDIYGTLVDTSGIVLDPIGILVTMQANIQVLPKVAFDGTNYLVVWQDVREDCDIYGARVTSSGLVLDPTGILISDAIYCQHEPQVIFGGNNFLVIWDDWRNGNLDIYGSRVTPAGNVLDPNGIPVSTAPYGQYYRQVAFSGSNYLIVWEDGRNGSPGYWDVYGARLGMDGVVLDPAGIPISTANLAQMSPQVAFDGVNYFIVWYDSRNTFDDIYGTRLSTDGVVLDPAGIPISTAPNWQRFPQISFDNTNYFIVWQDERAGSDSPDIYGARVNTAGVVLDPAGIPISTAVNQQFAPEVIFGGGNYFVAWNDERNTSWESDIYGARVSTAGSVLDPSGIPITTANYDQRDAQVIFDGSDYMLVWEDYTGVHGAKVTVSGSVSEFLIATMESWSPALVKGPGTQVLIVWEGWASAPYNTDRVWGKLIPTPGYVPWIALNPVPTTPSNKRVKGGGALAVVDNSFIFGLKGNNTRDFYCYDVNGRTWTLKESVPYNPDKPKRVKAGGTLIYGNDNLIYATKGNNTLEWLCYNTLSDTWRHLKPVPSLKGLKGGTGLAKVNKNVAEGIFLLKGSKSRENFIYYPDGDTWQKLPDAPVEFKKGSCAVGYDDSIVYVLKDKYNLFYRVNIQTGTWTLKDTLPFIGILRKKKKIKDGAALAFDGSNTIFAFKGGNTQEFWAYNIATNNWAELETIPRGLSKKRVKSGGSLAYLGGAVYALKGSNTDEFWTYAIAKMPILVAGQSEITSAKIESPKYDIFPNPSNGKFTIEYNSVLAKPSRIKIYNILGAIVWETANELKTDKLSFNLKNLAQGVYILSLENQDFELAHKLIIQK